MYVSTSSPSSTQMKAQVHHTSTCAAGASHAGRRHAMGPRQAHHAARVATGALNPSQPHVQAQRHAQHTHCRTHLHGSKRRPRHLTLTLRLRHAIHQVGGVGVEGNLRQRERETEREEGVKNGSGAGWRAVATGRGNYLAAAGDAPPCGPAATWQTCEAMSR